MRKLFSNGHRVVTIDWNDQVDIWTFSPPPAATGNLHPINSDNRTTSNSNSPSVVQLFYERTIPVPTWIISIDRRYARGVSNGKSLLIDLETGRREASWISGNVLHPTCPRSISISALSFESCSEFVFEMNNSSLSFSFSSSAKVPMK